MHDEKKQILPKDMDISKWHWSTQWIFVVLMAGGGSLIPNALSSTGTDLVTLKAQVIQHKEKDVETEKRVLALEEKLHVADVNMNTLLVTLNAVKDTTSEIKQELRSLRDLLMRKTSAAETGRTHTP